MIRSRRFVQCDVFSPTPTRGNALAVVLDGDGLDEPTMAALAAWTNLSETTFVLPPTDPAADYRVRILTPGGELPFAGHPTLGTCVAWLHAGGVPRTPGTVRQECGVGLVEVALGGEMPAFVAPPTGIEPLAAADSAAIVDALALDPTRVLATATLDNGPVWQLLELASADDVLRVDSGLMNSALPPVGLLGRHPKGSDFDYEVRMFAPGLGMTEDPITGSLNAAIAHWLVSGGRLDGDIVIAQGTAIGREGRVHIRPDPAVSGRVLIGGHVHVLVDGTLAL